MGAIYWLRTAILLGLLTGVLLAIGAFIGGTAGITVALALALLMNFVSYWFSDKIVLAIYGAKELSEEQAPKLHEIASELAKKFNVPKPKLYLIETHSPNAFATGRDPKHASIAVTAGLLHALDKAELRAVLAHEFSHIKNRDVLVATIAATIAGAIAYIAYIARWLAIFSAFGSDEREENIISLIVLAIVAPVIALIIQLAISRAREYLADETAAKRASCARELISALRKLEHYSARVPLNANPGTAHLFIVNPLSANSIVNLFSTHPPIEARIKRLEKIA